MRRGGLGQNDLPCKERGQTMSRKPTDLRDHWSEWSSVKELKSERKGLARAHEGV